MSSHDVLAYAIASRAIADIRSGTVPWNAVFSNDTSIGTSRDWPIPDAVLRDNGSTISAGMEFKPPEQTKREYITGLGQSIAYTRDFHYGLLVIPDRADDGYPIAEHLVSVLQTSEMAHLPVGVLIYDARTITPASACYTIGKFFSKRAAPPPNPRDTQGTFYAKWRETTPAELGRYLHLLFEESAADLAIAPKHKAFDRFWTELQGGHFKHWGGSVRHVANSKTNKDGYQKNIFNFARHLLWVNGDGRLENSGYAALRSALVYGTDSQIFRDVIARAMLDEGKHLVLITAIDEMQHQFPMMVLNNEATWRNAVIAGLEARGYVERNPGRAAAAVKGSPRSAFKAENQIWTELGFIKRCKSRVYWPGKGYMFNWAKITDLIKVSVVP